MIEQEPSYEDSKGKDDGKLRIKNADGSCDVVEPCKLWTPEESEKKEAIHIKDRDKEIENIVGMRKFRERQKFLDNPIYDKVFDDYLAAMATSRHNSLDSFLVRAIKKEEEEDAAIKGR